MNVGLQQLATPPTSPVKGQIYFNTGSNRAFIWNGTKWEGSDALDAVMSGADIVTALNSSDSTILDVRLSAEAQAAIAKAHDTHTIAGVEGLQSALDDKVDNSRVLTDVPKNAIFLNTLYSNGTGLNLSDEIFSVKYGDTAGTAAQGNDSRLSDARIPLAHTHGKITDDGAIGSTANLIVRTGIDGELNAMAAGSAGQFLSYNGNWATPPNDNTTYTNGAGLALTGNAFSVKFGTAVNTVPHGNDTRFSDTRVPKSHTHGKITDDGKIGIAADLMLKTGVGGEINTMSAGLAGQFLAHDGEWATPPDTNNTYTNGKGLTLSGNAFAVNFGTAVNTVPHGNDTRFFDSRTPKSHNHGNITNDGKIGTTANLIAQTGEDGVLTAKPVGTAAQFLNGLGAWATPPNQTYSRFSKTINGLVPAPQSAAATSVLRADGTWSGETAYSLPIAASGTLGGLKSSSSLSVHPTTGVATVINDGHTHTIAKVTGLQAELDAKETPSGAQTKAGTAETNANYYTDQAIEDLIGGDVDEALDTLYELAIALGEDPNFAATINAALGQRTKKHSETLKAYTSQVITHGLNTRDVVVTIRETNTPWAQVITDVEFTTVNTVTVKFAVAPAANQYTITVVG